MRAYTDLAFAGRAQEARRVRDSLNPVRDAMKRTRPAPSRMLTRNTGRNCWARPAARCDFPCWS